MFATTATFTSSHEDEDPPLMNGLFKKVSSNFSLVMPLNVVRFLLQIVTYYRHRKFYLIVVVVLEG
jgi:hypothetical protein